MIYVNRSKFKLNFEFLCESYGLQHKPTSIKNPQMNAIQDRMHQVIMTMLHTTELDMAHIVAPSVILDFLMDATWAVYSTYHKVLKASPGMDMLFDIPFLVDWNKIEEYRQCQINCNTQREKK